MYFFLIISELLKKTYFVLIISNYWNAGVTFSLLKRPKKSSMEKIMRLMLEEVIISDRHMSDIYFCNNFSTVKKLA